MKTPLARGSAFTVTLIAKDAQTYRADAVAG